MKRLLLIVLIVCHGFATAAYAQQRIDISGAWDFAMGDSTQEVLDMCSYISLPHAQGGVAGALSALLGV